MYSGNIDRAVELETNRLFQEHYDPEPENIVDDYEENYEVERRAALREPEFPDPMEGLL